MAYLMNQFKNQRAEGLSAKEVHFSEQISKSASRALEWLQHAYSTLDKVDLKSALCKVGYNKCWDDACFRTESMRRFGGKGTRVPPGDQGEEDRNEGGWDSKTIFISN
jgi:hypothetical protein